jgi:membrane glycosyltransferase
MLDRLSGSSVASLGAVPSLARRRALFAALVVAAIAGILWLAALAVPLRSVGAVLFLLLFAATLPWSVVGFWNATIGFLIMRWSRDPVAAVNPMAARISGEEPIEALTAILMCVRNESAGQVTRNLQPLLDGLAAAHVAQLFHVYLLSDTSDPTIVAAEEACFGAFAASWREIVPVTYRRRTTNTGFKAGNIRDFCDRWGRDHEFAVILDADSFIPAATVLRLVRLMRANPAMGLLQTLVIGLPSTSAFARLFQFGMRLGMHSYTLGAAWWQGDCGPYWGHNAILRLKPFIAHCDLPKLPQGGPLGGAILSHDQVEAALMRRAGYEVRVLPAEGISWEENPPTLLEYISRDLRWCQGNMQYWRLLLLPGLKPVSRFQLLFAILMYLGSPAWMALLTLGAVTIALADAPGAAAVGSGAGAALFSIMLVMIFAPKIASSLDVLTRRSARRSYGGAARFLFNVAAETLFSFLASPVMALSHSMFLFRLFVLRRGGAWNSQTRESHAVPWRLAALRLWPHTLAGLTVMTIVATKTPGGVFYAFLVAGGLALSIPFAVATAAPLLGALFARLGVGRLPEEIAPPAELQALRLPAIAAIAPDRSPVVEGLSLSEG